MDDDPIPLPADWQEGVASFLASFAEERAPSLEQLMPPKPEDHGPSLMAFSDLSDTFSLGTGCPFLEGPWPASTTSPSTSSGTPPTEDRSGGLGRPYVSSRQASSELGSKVDTAAAVVELRKKKLREKNRRAQQTYRNKQKRVIHDISSNLEELTLRVQQLEQEKADLETRNKMLRQVWSSTGELVAPTPSADTKPSAAAPTAMLFQAVRHFYLLVLPDEAHKVRTGHIDDITVDDFVRFWQVYAGKLRTYLQEGAEDPDSPAYQQLEALILAQRSHSLPFVPEDPVFATKATAAWARITAEAEEPTHEFWRRVLHALELSPAQKEAVLGIHCQLLARCEQLMQERQSILASLQASLPTYSEDLLLNPGLVYASHEAKRLALNLEHEKRAVLTCKRDFRCAILTPLQETRGILAGYPHLMDVRALCELVAEEQAAAGDPG